MVATRKKKQLPVPDAPELRVYEPIGHARELLVDKSKELLACGVVGSGKSRVCLEKIHFLLQKYPGSRALMVRKTRSSLTQTGIVTLDKEVLPPGFSKLHSEKQSYIYPNGSEFVVGGLDDSTKIMSGQYDIIYVQEATEIREADWEDLITRLRNYKMPYQQILGDCNPSHPNHWLKKRCDNQTTKLITFWLQDNPVYYSVKAGEWTDKGKDYVSSIERLSGARYLRNVKGIWAASEGLVYDGYDPDVHRIPRSGLWIPNDWPRIWTFDFGFRNPFVWQEWVLDQDDPRHDRGVMYLNRQIYRKGILIQRAAQKILELMDIEPSVVVCDHDAQGRAILEDELECNTWPAKKSVLDNVERCQERINFVKDRESGIVEIEPTIYFIDNGQGHGSLIHKPDPVLKKMNHPTCTEEEFLVYTWDDPKRVDGLVLEKPKKMYDHGMDGMQYAVAQVDLVGLSEGVY